MKITKQVKSSPSSTVACTTSSCSEAQKHIRAAIDSLGKQAKDNVIAKEAIANLSVILFDLQ